MDALLELISPSVNSHSKLDLASAQLKKFSLDGNYLIALSQQQHALLVFAYNYPGSKYPEKMAENVEFLDVFTELYNETLTFGPELLSSDFCLFSGIFCQVLSLSYKSLLENGSFLILASSISSSVAESVQNRSLNPSALNCIPALDNITFWVIEIKTARVADKFTLYVSHSALPHLIRLL